MTLASAKNAQPMIGQVGGVSFHKKPLLSLSPDYILKPVLTDHRGIREIAFYEAMTEAEVIVNNHHKYPSRQQAYAQFLKGSTQQNRNNNTTLLSRMRDIVDTLALAFALLLKDRTVVASEEAVAEVWRITKREVELMHTLRKFTPPYYGVIGQTHPSLDDPFGVTEDAHLLLHDLTSHYTQPVVMDLKMGTQSFEPDAPLEKRHKEANKYKQQAEFGFRIVGMRIYQPDHKETDESGYRSFGKHYGRNLETREQVKEALKIYFSAGVGTSDSCFDDTTTSSHATTNGSNTRIPSNRHQDLKDKGVHDDGQHHKERMPAKKKQVMLRVKSISNLLVQVRSIQGWFEDHNTGLWFCASSLLCIYEGHLSCQAPDVTTVKMIDFGRVRRNPPPHLPGTQSRQSPQKKQQHPKRTPAQERSNHQQQQEGGDSGYLYGLQTLQHMLVELIQEARETEEEDAGNQVNGTR